MAKEKAPAKDAKAAPAKEAKGDKVTEKIAAESKGGKAGKSSAVTAAKGEKAPVKSITKAQFVTKLMEHADLSRPQAVATLEAMTNIIVENLGKKGPGVLTLPGLLKLKAKRVPAVKGGKEVDNRFKPGEKTLTKDKPAHTKVSARALKGLKELLAK